MECFRPIWKVSIHSEIFVDTRESFWTLGKVSKTLIFYELFWMFGGTLESLYTIWEVSGFGVRKLFVSAIWKVFTFSVSKRYLRGVIGVKFSLRLECPGLLVLNAFFSSNMMSNLVNHIFTTCYLHWFSSQGQSLLFKTCRFLPHLNKRPIARGLHFIN